MTLVAVVSLLLGVAALLLYLVAEAAFEALFGYIGAAVVWLGTLGRVRMQPLCGGGESELASGVGLVFAVVVAASTCYIIQRQ